MTKLIDETGKKYGALQVIEPIKINGRTLWHCLCDCGNFKDIKGTDLRGGKVTSCGCHINRSKKQVRDLTGQHFGYLTALEFIPESLIKDKSIISDYRYGAATWKCLCDCGNTTYVSSYNLISNNTKSCGCKHKFLQTKDRISDYKGKVFGELTVLETYFDDNKEKWFCRCLCSCGKEVSVSPKQLASGHTQSCGHKGYTSRPVLKIEQFLEENKINYKREFSYENLKSKRGAKLRFDFAIFDEEEVRLLIEYNGQQHYKPVDFWGGEEKFLIQQENDNLKKQYCKENNIILVVYDYDQSIEYILKDLKERLL